MQDTLLDKMPDSMRKEVEKLLESIPATRKRPERFTRKEQAKQAVSGVPAGPATTAPATSATAAAPQEEEVTCHSRDMPRCTCLLPLMVPLPQQQVFAATTEAWSQLLSKGALTN